MGKRIIIPGADFSVNAIGIAKAVEGTQSPQYVYVANTKDPSESFDWNSHKVAVTIDTDGTIKSFNIPDNTTALPYFFSGASLENSWIKEVDLSYLSQYPLTTLKRLLYGSLLLDKVLLSGRFDNVRGYDAVTNMFYNCNHGVDVVIDPGFNAPQLTSLELMFNRSHVKSIKGLEYLITSKITNMNYMFTYCDELEEIDFSGCNTENVTTFMNLFNNTPSLSRLIGINELNTANVTDYTRAFGEVGQLTKLDISNWSIAPNAVTTNMFLGAQIYEINANCFTALYGDISNMFYLTKWYTIHLDNLNDVSAVTNSTDLFSSYTGGETPKVTIANVTNAAVKTLLINALNARTVGGSSNWHEATVDGVLCLVP